MELDFVHKVLNVAAFGSANIDDPVVREAFLCGPTAQNRSVAELKAHLHRLSSQIGTINCIPLMLRSFPIMQPVRLIVEIHKSHEKHLVCDVDRVERFRLT